MLSGIPFSDLYYLAVSPDIKLFIHIESFQHPVKFESLSECHKICVIHQFRIQLWESIFGVSVLANAVCAVGVVMFCTALSYLIKKTLLFSWLV